MESLSTDMDILVLREQAGKGAKIEMIEEVKSGKGDTPGQAGGQLDKAVERLGQLADGSARIRLELEGRDVTAEIDLSTVKNAKLQRTGPANGKKWDSSLGISPDDLFGMARSRISVKSGGGDAR